MNETDNVENPATDTSYEWAIVEVFGHRRHVGRAMEVERFGAKMLRVDVPKLGPGESEVTWSTHLYGGSSIFSYTPTDEKTVMNYAERVRAAPAAIPYRDHGQTMEEAEADNFGLTADDLDEDELDDDAHE